MPPSLGVTAMWRLRAISWAVGHGGQERSGDWAGHGDRTEVFGVYDGSLADGRVDWDQAQSDARALCSWWSGVTYGKDILEAVKVDEVASQRVWHEERGEDWTFKNFTSWRCGRGQEHPQMQGRRGSSVSEAKNAPPERGRCPVLPRGKARAGRSVLCIRNTEVIGDVGGGQKATAV